MMKGHTSMSTMTVNTTTAADLAAAHSAVAAAKDVLAALDTEFGEVKSFTRPGYSAQWRRDFKLRYTEAVDTLAVREAELREAELGFNEAERLRLLALRPGILREHREAVQAVVAALPAFRAANLRLRQILIEHGSSTSLEIGPLAVADAALEHWLRDAEAFVKQRR